MPNAPSNSTDLHIELISLVLISRRPAEAVETSAPRSTVAPTAARSSLQIFIPESFIDVDYRT